MDTILAFLPSPVLQYLFKLCQSQYHLHSQLAAACIVVANCTAVKYIEHVTT